ncbi:MAG: FAD-dependent oxidoreductase [bacterium]|nr:FAD-dependent oxidoreductase [bacterium]
MRAYDYLIIGGGIAGVTAAETIRSRLPQVSIGIVSSEPEILYSRVLLPAYVKGKIPRSKLFLRTHDRFAEQKIDLVAPYEAMGIDVSRREVRLNDGTFIRYGALLVASGGHVKPWGEKKDKSFVYRLQTIEDADRLLAAIPGIRKPIVIGTSFIGLEFLETFVLHKIMPTALMRDEYFFGNFVDAVGGELFHRHLRLHGVAFSAKTEIAGLTRAENEVKITTAAGHELTVDALAVGVGIDRSFGFLEGSGVALGAQGVLTNEFLETNEPGIFAAGDVAEFYDIVSGTHHTDGNWTSAFLQGRQVGLTMVGERAAFNHLATYSITNFGLQITALGSCINADTPGSEAISRHEEEGTRYERFFFRDGALAGAFLINHFSDKMHLAALITSRTRVGEWRRDLQDPRFDIRRIVVNPPASPTSS